MALDSELKYEYNSYIEEEVEGVFDLEAELISYLEALKKTRRNKKQPKEQYLRVEEGNYHSDEETFNIQKM